MNKTNKGDKQNERHGNKEETDSDQRGRGKRTGEKEGEGSNHGTRISDAWTWTTGWGLTVGVRGGQGSVEQQGKNWDNYNRTIQKKSCTQKIITH